MPAVDLPEVAGGSVELAPVPSAAIALSTQKLRDRPLLKTAETQRMVISNWRQQLATNSLYRS
jgi:hypothetical protein